MYVGRMSSCYLCWYVFSAGHSLIIVLLSSYMFFVYRRKWGNLTRDWYLIQRVAYVLDFVNVFLYVSSVDEYRAWDCIVVFLSDLNAHSCL